MLTLIDFYADWCGPCVAMKPMLERIALELKDKIILEKVNVDENQTKAQDYVIMSIPTLVLSKDGKEIDRKTGLLPENLLKEWIISHL